MIAVCLVDQGSEYSHAWRMLLTIHGRCFKMFKGKKTGNRLFRWLIFIQFLLIMYHDNYEEDDLAAEVELVTSAQFTQDTDVEDGFGSEGNFWTTRSKKSFF